MRALSSGHRLTGTTDKIHDGTGIVIESPAITP
jgi:hypothetical protein